MSGEHDGLTVLLISTRKEYENAIGKRFYLGEFLGKHKSGIV